MGGLPKAQIPLQATGAGELDDAQLARAVVARASTAERAVFDRYAPLVRGLLVRALGPGEVINDATQETFLIFFHRVSTLRDPALLRSFLVGIALRVARKVAHRRWLQRRILLMPWTEVPEQQVLPIDSEGRQALVAFERLISKLSAEDRMVFALRYVEEWELTEVAAAADVSLATIKRRLARINKRINALVAQEPELAQRGLRLGQPPQIPVGGKEGT